MFLSLRKKKVLKYLYFPLYQNILLAEHYIADGAGGKGTWGKLIDTDADACLDRNDPNYDSGEVITIGLHPFTPVICSFTWVQIIGCSTSICSISKKKKQ